MRAQRLQGQSPQSPQSPPAPRGEYEMTGLPNQDGVVSGNGARVSVPAGSGGGMSDFYAEINSLQDAIQEFDSNVARISDMHSRSLNAMDDALTQQNAAVLDELVANTRMLSNQLRNRIQALAKQPTPPGQDARIRQNQTQLVRTRFMEVLQRYQEMERDYRARYRQRVERQFKIVKPDATPEEISAVVDDDDGQGGQVFAQALTSTTRYRESRLAYNEVQERHQDIRKIENTLAELATLFNDMDTLVLQQGEAIDQIEQSATRVEHDTEQGLKQTEIAVKHARSARKKRWICFFIFLLVIAILAIVLGVVFGKK